MKFKVSKIFVVLMIVVIALLLGLYATKVFVYPFKYKEQIIKYSKSSNLDPYLVMAIINTESGFDANATSNKEAKGLMQITPATAQEMNLMTNSAEVIDENNIYDVDVNISIGCYYISHLISRYDGNYYLAVCAYNAGIGNVNKWIEEGKVPKDLSTTDIELPFKETTDYLNKVIKDYNIYKKLYISI